MLKEIISVCNEVVKIASGGLIDNNKLYNDIRPTSKDGYRIYYSQPYHTVCPFHNCTTYRTSSDEYVYCPNCQRLLCIYY